jgi:hypothetical protein
LAARTSPTLPPTHPPAPADGFPLKKAQQYAVLRKPYLVNDVQAQDTLLDRRRVYRTLMASAGAAGDACAASAAPAR